MTIRVLSVIVADDIRHEANGKVMVVGWYSSGLATSGFPVDQKVDLVVHLEGEIDDFRLERCVIGLKMASGGDLGELSVSVPDEAQPETPGINLARKVHIELNGVPLICSAPDVLDVYFGTTSEAASVVYRFPIALKIDEAATALKQLTPEVTRPADEAYMVAPR